MYENLFQANVSEQIHVAKMFIKNMKIKEEMMKTEKWRTISYKWLVYPDQGPRDWSLFMSALFVLFTELEINYYYYYNITHTTVYSSK